MKTLFTKVIGISVILFFIVVQVAAQPRLSWRMTNPRVVYVNPDNFLEFDIQVQSDIAGKFFKGMTIVLNFNGSGLSQLGADWTVTKGLNYSPLNSQGAFKYSITTSVNGGKWNIGYTSDINVESHPASSADFTPLLTTWDTWAIVRIKILDPSLIAGTTFRPIDAGGFSIGAYRDAGGVANLMNLTPHKVDTKDFRFLYAGRIYNSVTGWTQIGGALNWATALNTSIWDSVASMNNAAGLVNKLRIHPTSSVAGANQVASLPGGRLRILSGGAITASDSTIIEETRGLVIGSELGMAQFKDNGTITYNTGGTAQAFVKFAQDKWHYYAIPFQSTIARPFANIYMKYYQEPTDHWKYVMNNNFSPDTTLNTSMVGYALWAAATGTYANPGYAGPSGLLNTTPATSYQLKVTPANLLYAGYNLVGNPYTCEVDLAQVNWGTVTAQAWFWDPTAANYTVYPVYNGTYGTHSQYAPAQQGFFVKATVNNSTISIPQAAKRIGAETFLKQGNDFDNLLFIEATTTASEQKDKISVFFVPEATAGYDEGIDAQKLWGGFDAPQLYSKVAGDQNLTLNGQPWIGESQVVQLGFSDGVSGDFKFTASGVESFDHKYVYLVDKVTNTWQELNQNPVYTFSYTAGEADNRFELHFMTFALGTSSPEMTTMKIYSNEEYLYVMNVDKDIQKGKVELFDMTGRSIFVANLMNNKVSKYNPNVTEGYYAVKVTTQNGTYSQKVYLK